MTSFQQKYAPTRLATYQFEDSNVHATISDYAAGLRSGALLLHGPNGTGKSTIARLIAKELMMPNSVNECWLTIVEGQARDVAKQIDSLNGGMRWQTIEGAVVPVGIINEADLLPIELQYRIRALVESFTCTLVLTCNQPEQITSKLYSRCHILRVNAPSPQQWLSQAQRILRQEGVTQPDALVLKLLETCEPSIVRYLETLETLVLRCRVPLANSTSRVSGSVIGRSLNQIASQSIPTK